MPTIAVDKQDLFDLLGKTYSTEEFDELCFEFGIELDEDTTEECVGDERPQLKIEIPANRYDMLCIEGIAQLLNEFLSTSKQPVYKWLSEPKTSLTIKPSTLLIRPYASAAILRNIKFTQRGYDSFISLQDKLHTNLCRNRTLVAMGTHDLDKLKGPFVYELLPPNEIKFTPLNQTKKMTGAEMMEFYEKDKNLGKYLHIIKDSPVYPVIRDSEGTVGSMPPIINSDHSKITLDTRNVFLDITGTDRTKVEIVVNQLVAMFSRYCDEPFTVEPVQIISEHNNESRIAPNMKPRIMKSSKSYINSCLGLDLSTEDISKLLVKMSLKVVGGEGDILDVEVPVTRPDVLHQCDVMEDAAIAFGYENVPESKVKVAALTSYPLPINKISDILRLATAQSGWLEVLPLTLCSHDENFKFLKVEDDGKTAVKLSNPKTVEYQVVRTTLLPGILKTIKENRKHSLPIKIFEAGDIVLKDDSLERGAFNQRNWAAIYIGKTSGFEIMQGLLAKIMQTMRVDWLQDPTSKSRGYYIEQDDKCQTFFPQRGAKVFLRLKDNEEVKEIGKIGVLHPEVLGNFDIPYAGSFVEINAQVFL